VRRAGSIARDCFTGQADRREVTVGDALDTLTLPEMFSHVREAIGPPATTLSHTADILIEETCRVWPERTMADLARRLDSEEAGGKVLDAISVITAAVRERVEARYGCDASDKAAIDLLLRAVVIEVANLWFTGVEARIAMRRIMFVIRSQPRG